MARRSADFAGSWYPGRDSECRRVIEEFSRSSVPCPSGATIGGIVPHAGGVFSGKITCNLPRGGPPAPGSLRIGERAVEISRDLGRKTFVLGSTDLTHYGYNYGYAPKGVGKAAVDWVKKENDKRLVDLILRSEE